MKKVIAITLALLTMQTGWAQYESKLYSNDAGPDKAFVAYTRNQDSPVIWEEFAVLVVGSQFVSMRFYRDDDYGPLGSNVISSTANRMVKPLNVPSGKQTLVVGARFTRGTGVEGLFEAYVPVIAKLDPGVMYRTNGEVVGKDVFAWIEEVATGKIASDKGVSAWVRTLP